MVLLLVIITCSFSAVLTDETAFETFKKDILQKVKALEEKVSQLEDSNRDQNKEIVIQKNIINQQQQELAVLRDFMTSVGNVHQNNGSAPFVQSDGKTTSDALMRLFNRRQAPMSDVISFYAYLSKPILSLSLDHDIHFDRVVTNNGNGYASNIGTFTVPETGLYVFMWSITGQGGVPLQLTKNGAVIGRSDPTTGSDKAFGNVSGFVITYAEENDVLLMKTHSTTHASGKIYSNEYHQSGFGGWRIG